MFISPTHIYTLGRAVFGWRSSDEHSLCFSFIPLRLSRLGRDVASVPTGHPGYALLKSVRVSTHTHMIYFDLGLTSTRPKLTSVLTDTFRTLPTLCSEPGVHYLRRHAFFRYVYYLHSLDVLRRPLLRTSSLFFDRRRSIQRVSHTHVIQRC